MRVDLLSIMKMTDEELARALSVPSQEPLDELDQIALRQALEEERERRARDKIQKESEGGHMALADRCQHFSFNELSPGRQLRREFRL